MTYGPLSTRDGERRSTAALRYWLPLVLSLLTSVLMIGVIYGHLGGRLDLIEYRLKQIESKLTER